MDTNATEGTYALERVNRTKSPDIRALVPRDFAEIWTLSERLADSALVPAAYRKRPHDIFMAIEYGMEIGIAPIQSLMSIHVIDGRPSMSAILIVGLIKASPLCKYFVLVESTGSKATYRTLRAGDPEPTVMTYTIDQAKAAGLTGKRNWQTDPEGMCRSRCASRLGRVVYPDVIGNMYPPDEVEEMRDREAERDRTAIEATVVAPPPPVVPPAPKRSQRGETKPLGPPPVKPVPTPPPVAAGHTMSDDWTSDPVPSQIEAPPPPPPSPEEPGRNDIDPVLDEWRTKIDATTDRATCMALFETVPDALLNVLRPLFRAQQNALIARGVVWK